MRARPRDPISTSFEEAGIDLTWMLSFWNWERSEDCVVIRMVRWQAVSFAGGGVGPE